ncbi:oligopeptide transporter-like protein [Eremomyces bilateralis CBS 781.70]|uniref:Oligopeptide transporter-like protein n=1 Tax=Eremomyces bilateralis CBS 781.70 TaxID=1392243 RepID=A0A6G1G6P6_9PEZI|nr:oligopeptide transporter-like protein [Eremomyces bilateralis CBS 781.70]KAF1813723.1 oligopeptide transporter-like protein [Eremomyces bilateralis CBS 781.70]
MAPDRGSSSPSPSTSHIARSDSHLSRSRLRSSQYGSTPHLRRTRSSAAASLAARSTAPQNFTLRALLVGLGIGVIICFSNTYFGLQTGWVSSMAMPSALIGFAFFRSIQKALPVELPFTPVENVLVQTVAGSVGTMPLGCGFVGVMPALNFLLKDEEGGPLRLGLWKLIVWAVGICFFGVVFAVPLRRQVIIREKLKFPSGTATAHMIALLHGKSEEKAIIEQEGRKTDADEEETEQLVLSESHGRDSLEEAEEESDLEADDSRRDDWKAKINLLVVSFGISALYTVISYFIPRLRDIPIFGTYLESQWLWTLNPSPAYIGQGIIMGPETTIHMLLGAILGWGILSPLAKAKNWAPGPVRDWERGSKGWIVWISLAIMLADSLVSLAWLILQPVVHFFQAYLSDLRARNPEITWSDILLLRFSSAKGYTALPSTTDITTKLASHYSPPEADAPPSALISTRVTLISLFFSLLVCILAIHYSFPGLIPFRLTILSLVLALLLSVMGVRALGETDLNPVSGISKLTQLLIALAVPSGSKNAIMINLVAGAVSESGALQAGDLMQDLKTGHLLGAAPKAQFWGQIIGSGVGAVVSALVYRLYVSVYDVPGGLFEVPTAYVWVFTARLVTGKGLPEMVPEWAVGAGVLWAVATVVRMWGRTRKDGRGWTTWVPGGIAVAVGMYNTPSFTLARTIGGLVDWYWRSYLKREDSPVIVLASGLILGEGLFSIVNLILASAKVPHL